MADPDKILCRHLAAAVAGREDRTAEEVIKAANYVLTGDPLVTAPPSHVASLLAREAGLYHAFRHLDFRGRSYDPLWARDEIIAAAKALAGYPQATLLVSGLVESVGRGTDRRVGGMRRNMESYAEAREHIDTLVAQYTPPGCSLRIIHA